MSLLYYSTFIVVALVFILFLYWKMRHPIEVLGLTYNRTKKQLELKVKNKRSAEHHIKSALRLIQPVIAKETTKQYPSGEGVMLEGNLIINTEKTYDLIGEDDKPLMLGPNETKTIVYDIASPTADITCNKNVMVNISYGIHPDFLNTTLYRETIIKPVNEVLESTKEAAIKTVEIPKLLTELDTEKKNLAEYASKLKQITPTVAKGEEASVEKIKSLKGRVKTVKPVKIPALVKLPETKVDVRKRVTSKVEGKKKEQLDKEKVRTVRRKKKQKNREMKWKTKSARRESARKNREMKWKTKEMRWKTR